MTNPPPSMDSASRLALARLSLDGLSLGDAYGTHFDFDARLDRPGAITAPPLPPGPWRWTDDTQMALSIFAELRASGTIDPDRLAASFARHFEWSRGYGSGASRLLEALRAGGSWRELSPNQHRGQGSCGNGAAMRVAPLGAYFAGRRALLLAEAERSAVVTHAHPDGVAGAIAVAAAAAIAARRDPDHAPRAFLEEVAATTPAGAVRSGLERALRLEAGATVGEAVAALGHGAGFLATDTVPFALWSAATNLSDLARALERTASGLGDVDTNCAIVGGVVALAVGREGIPVTWIERREPLPGWIDA